MKGRACESRLDERIDVIPPCDVTFLPPAGSGSMPTITESAPMQEQSMAQILFDALQRTQDAVQKTEAAVLLLVQRKTLSFSSCLGLLLELCSLKNFTPVCHHPFLGATPEAVAGSKASEENVVGEYRSCVKLDFPLRNLADEHSQAVAVAFTWLNDPR